MAGRLDALTEAIDGLAALDLDALDDADLHEFVVGLGAQSNRLQAAWCRLIHRWDRRQVWADNGSKAPGARLARETRMPKSDADRLVHRGRDLTSMPETSKAYGSGEINGDHVDLIASCNRPWREADFADAEPALVDFCRAPYFGDAVRATKVWKYYADQEAAEHEGDIVRQGRHLSASTGWQGEVVINGILDPVNGEIFKTELDRIYEQLRLQDLRDGVERSVQQRRADALVEMATRSATAPADGLRPRPLITVLIGSDMFTHLCELGEGAVITPGQLVPLLTDAEIERIIYDPPNRRIEASHRRTFTGAIRRIIEVRDRYCQHQSGCDVPARRCDVDHIEPRSEGGITCICNGQLLCATHNRIIKNHHRRAPTKRQRSGDPLPTERDDRNPWTATDDPAESAGAPRSPPQAS